MKRLEFFLIFCSLQFLIGCSSAPIDSSSVVQSFSEVRKIGFDVRKESFQRKFGAPNDELAGEEGSEVWIYGQMSTEERPGYLTQFGFDRSGHLKRITYFFNSKKQEPRTVTDLEAQTGYKFVAPEASTCGLHYSPNARLMFDVKNNVSVERNAKGELWLMSWGPPLSEEQRRIASLPTGCPPSRE